MIEEKFDVFLDDNVVAKEMLWQDALALITGMKEIYSAQLIYGSCMAIKISSKLLKGGDDE